jgi:signal peptidase I
VSSGAAIGAANAKPTAKPVPPAKNSHPAKPEEETDVKPVKRMNELARWVVEIVIWVVAALVLSTLLRLLVFQMFIVPSESMEDTLMVGDRIAALKHADVQRGDIVVFEDPGNWVTDPGEPVGPVHEFFEKIGVLASTDQQYLVKRVIGLPGDHVQCCSTMGRLLVNGVEIDESSYLKEPMRAASGIVFDVTVPAGRYFVLGDNRYDSADSRYHLCQQTAMGLGMNGFVPEANVIGPVRAVVLPFSRIGHRGVPTEVFQNVPAPQNAPPEVPSVMVTSGFSTTCSSPPR